MISNKRKSEGTNWDAIGDKICAILSANGFGMKCVYASTRIMDFSPPIQSLVPRRRPAGRSVRDR